MEDTSTIWGLDTQGNLIKQKPHPRFKDYEIWFKNLIRSQRRKTSDPIISMIITYDAKNLIAVMKANYAAYYVRLYEIEDLKMIFEQLIGDPFTIAN